MKTFRKSSPRVSEISAVLAEALYEDGMSTFLFPETKARDKYLSKIMELFVLTALRQGTVNLLETESGEAVGAALWFGPEDPHLHTMTYIRRLLSPTRIGILFHWLPRLKKVLDFGDISEEFHSRIEGKHQYLALLGLRPEFRNRKLGGRFMELKIEEAKREKQALYLESCNPENLGFYQRFGFRIQNQTKNPGQPVFTTLFLDPSSSRSEHS